VHEFRGLLHGPHRAERELLGDLFGEIAKRFALGVAKTFQVMIFTQVSILLYRVPAVVRALIASELLSSIGWADDGLFAVNLRIAIAATASKVICITVAIATALTGLATVPENASHLLKLWSVFITKSYQHPAPQPVLAAFVGSAALYRFADCISMFLAVHARFPELHAAVLLILQAGVAGPVPGVAGTCCRAFTHMRSAVAEVPLAPIIAAIASGACVDPGMEVLARLEYVPASTRLVSAVLAAGRASPLAIVVLCRLAATSSPRTAAGWPRGCSPPPTRSCCCWRSASIPARGMRSRARPCAPACSRGSRQRLTRRTPRPWSRSSGGAALRPLHRRP
jgi:hypothetical protein